MGKINGENSDLKSKLNIVSGIIANAKKDLESLKTEINDVKSDRAMFKKDLNSLNNEFSEYLKESLKVTDNLIKIDNDILMTKNESYINIRNQHHFIKNDTLIFRSKCIKLKSMIRKNVKSLKNIKNNLYNVKKYSVSIQIDLKKLKEEFINNSNKRAKTRSIIFPKIKAYNFKRIMRELAVELALTFNNSKTKTNIKDSGIFDACTSTGDPIFKKYVHACTSTDDVCTNENEPCTNENEPCTNENEACTKDEDDDDDGDDDDEDDDGDADNDEDDDEEGKDNKDDDDDDNNSDIGKLENFIEKVINK